MKRADPRQFDMFAAIEPTPAVAPMVATRWETVPIAQRAQPTAAAVRGSYSAQSLCESGRVTRPFRFRGAEWIFTGGAFRRGDADFECYRIVPAASFEGPGDPARYGKHPFFGPHRDALGAYHGMMAKHRNTDVVLIGPPVVLVLKGSAA